MNGKFSSFFKLGNARNEGAEVSIVLARKHDGDLAQRHLEATQSRSLTDLGGRFSKKSPTLFAIVASVALVLSGCIGGGGDGPATSGDTTNGDGDSVAPPDVTLSDARTASPLLVEVAGMSAVNNAPALTHPTGVTQSTSPASVTTMFDGTNVELTVDRQTGGDFTLGSAANSVTETLVRFPLPPSPIPGHTLRDWTLFDYSQTGTSAAHVTISWNDNDATDYLVGGYWMHLSGDLNEESIASADIGAFVDGPEFSGTPTLPALGEAAYRGHASGLYTFYYGPGWQHIPVPEGIELPADGTWEAGVYTGIVQLTANFETNTVSGCIGCMLPGEDPLTILLEVTGDTIDSDGNRGVLASQYINTPGRNFARIRFADTPIDSNTGTFSGTDVTLEIDYFPSQTGSTSGGTWGGTFSNISNEAGAPRLVGGTTGAEWNNPAGGRAVFIGSFFATTPEEN